MALGISTSTDSRWLTARADLAELEGRLSFLLRVAGHANQTALAQRLDDSVAHCLTGKPDCPRRGVSEAARVGSPRDDE